MNSSTIPEVIQHLKDYLLTSDLKDTIVKILLFDSHAKKAVTVHSDIDVLIFMADSKEQERLLMDLVYDFMLENNAPIKVMAAHIADLFIEEDFFIANIIRYGVEIYSMEKEAIKRAMIRNLLHLCHEYLESAKDVLALSYLRLAIDAGYNAAELAVKILLFRKQDRIPGPQDAPINLFTQLYGQTDEMDKGLGQALHIALRFGNKARYRPDASLSQKDAHFVIELAERLINLVSKDYV